MMVRVRVKVRVTVRVVVQVMVGGRVTQVALSHAPVSKAIISIAIVSMAHRERDHAPVMSVLLVGLHAVPHLVALHAILHDRAVLRAQPLRLHLALANVEGRCACVRACIRGYVSGNVSG